MPRNIRTRCVIAYDVTDDARRTKLSELLLDYGERVQKSVFEADLDAEDVKEILHRAAKYVEREDSLRIYPLSGPGGMAVQSLGRVVQVTSPALRIV